MSLDMTLWDHLSLWGNTPMQWLVALGVTIGMLAVLRVVMAVMRRLARTDERHHGVTRSWIAALAGSVRLTLLFPLAVYAGERLLVLPGNSERVLRTVVVIALLLQAAIWVQHTITFALGRYQQSRDTQGADDAAMLSVVSLVGRIILWSLLALLILDALGIDVSAVVAGLGIGGIAVALAAQNILGDLFSSLSIMLDRPFVVGDFIIVGDSMGTVEHVGMKTTRVRSLAGEQLIFSNADILQARIRNYQRMEERRIVFTIGAVYATPYRLVEQIPQLIRTIIEAQELTRFDRSHFARYADSALEFEVVYYVLAPEYNRYMDIQQRINLEIFRQFEDLGIEFAFPSRTLYVQHTDPVFPAPPAPSAPPEA